MVLPCKAVTDSSVQLSVNTEFSHEIPFHNKMWKHCQADLRVNAEDEAVDTGWDYTLLYVVCASLVF